MLLWILWQSLCLCQQMVDRIQSSPVPRYYLPSHPDDFPALADSVEQMPPKLELDK